MTLIEILIKIEKNDLQSGETLISEENIKFTANGDLLRIEYPDGDVHNWILPTVLNQPL